MQAEWETRKGRNRTRFLRPVKSTAWPWKKPPTLSSWGDDRGCVCVGLSQISGPDAMSGAQGWDKEWEDVRVPLGEAPPPQH